MTEVALSKMSIDEAVSKLIAPTGNQLEIVKVANSALFRLRWKNNGKLPEDEGISGSYTKPEYAIKDAEVYLRRFWEKADKSKKSAGKAEDKGGTDTQE